MDLHRKGLGSLPEFAASFGKVVCSEVEEEVPHIEQHLSDMMSLTSEGHDTRLISMLALQNLLVLKTYMTWKR